MRVRLPLSALSPLFSFLYRFYILFSMREILANLFNISSIWFFVFQTVIWFAVCIGIIASTDVARPERSYGKIKQNLGLLLLFIILSSGLIYIMFGQTS